MADRKLGRAKTDRNQTNNHARRNLQFSLHGNPKIPNHKTGRPLDRSGQLAPRHADRFIKATRNIGLKKA